MGLKGKTAADPAAAGVVEDVSFAQRLNDALLSNRRILLAFGILAVAAVVAIGVISAINSRAADKATAAIEALDARYEAWSALEPAKRAGETDALVADADAVIKSYGKRYAVQRALMLKAQVYHGADDLSAAEKAYADLASRFPDSHMAPVALSNAAAMAEDRGDSDAALRYLETAETKYPDAPAIGRVVLSIGRIYEGAKRYDKAMEAYGRLVAGGTDSDWTKLARDRIIVLKSLGLAK